MAHAAARRADPSGSGPFRPRIFDVFYDDDWGWHGAGVLEARTQRVLDACDATTWFSAHGQGGAFGALTLSLVDGGHFWLYATTGLFGLPVDTVLTHEASLLAQAAAYNPAPGVKVAGGYHPHTGPLLEWQGRYWLSERADVAGSEVSTFHLEYRRESYRLMEVVPLDAARAAGLPASRRGYRELVETHRPGVIFDWARPGRPPVEMVVTDHLAHLASPLRVSARPPRHVPPPALPSRPAHHRPPMAAIVTQLRFF